MLSSEKKNCIKGLLKLLIRGALLALLCYLGHCLLFDLLWLEPDAPIAYDISYEKGLLKQVHALQSKREDNVIIFGASYVSFGIDAAEMESILGQPVQTLGVEASMGIPVLIDLLKKTAQPGDTVIYMLGEANSSAENSIAICAALESDKELLYSYIASRDGLKDKRSNLIWRKLYALTIGKPVIRMEALLSKKKQVYSIDSFDERGNMVVDRPGPLDTLVIPFEKLDMEDIELETMDKLNLFIDWCGANEVNFVVAYAPFMEESLDNSSEELDAFHEEISAYLHADFIDKPQDTLLPADRFYNHPSHLNSVGAKEYSHDLAERLKKYREEKSCDSSN
ncbi:MAG: hypothetical protein IK115_07515 [Lachnospiraceae bacterium]|nr:hypothetical protein [Lachnospiraceae bacterium]